MPAEPVAVIVLVVMVLLEKMVVSVIVLSVAVPVAPVAEAKLLIPIILLAEPFTTKAVL